MSPSVLVCVRVSFLAFCGVAACTQSAEIKPDEKVTFFPTMTWPVAGKGWEVEIHGWVYEAEPRRVRESLLRKALGLIDETLDEQARAVFAERSAPFLADSERGMSELYRSWAESAGAAFHYVSASPWQLYQPLQQFLDQDRFPKGTVQLKNFRWKDESFFDLFSSQSYKMSQIETILKRVRGRRFILVGDSGEKDPEIYGALAHRHAGQIRRIFIRDVTGEPAASERYAQAFKNVPADRWRVFQDPSQLRQMAFE